MYILLGRADAPRGVWNLLEMLADGPDDSHERNSTDRHADRVGPVVPVARDVACPADGAATRAASLGHALGQRERRVGVSE